MKFKKFIQTIFILAILGGTVSPGHGFTAADYINAGLQVYAKKDYALAIRYFTAALSLNPTDTRALQSRGNCYYFLGKSQEALNDYEKILSLSPSGPVSQFVQSLRAKLGAVSPAAPVSVQAGTSVQEGAGKPAGLGLRLEPTYWMTNLSDFTADAETGKADAAQSQVGDPSYKFNSTIPSGFIGFGVEPVAQIGSFFEVGIPFVILPLGTVLSSTQGALGDSSSISYALSAFSIGLNGRLVLGSGPVRVFLAGGPAMLPVQISYNNSNTVNSTTVSGSGNFSSSAFGGQGQLGFDFHVGDPFVLSLYGGYQTASANGFKGTLTTSGNGPTTTDPGQLGVFDDTNGKKITFLKDGDPAPLNFRPLQIDLSGVIAGIHLAIFF